MARLLEILDSVPNLRNGMSLPPEQRAEVELVFAQLRAAGVAYQEGKVPPPAVQAELAMIFAELEALRTPSETLPCGCLRDLGCSCPES